MTCSLCPGTWSAFERDLWPHFFGLVAPLPRGRRTLARIHRWSVLWSTLETVALSGDAAARDAARRIAEVAAERLARDRVAVAAVALVWGADPWRLVAQLGTSRDRRACRACQRLTRAARVHFVATTGPLVRILSTEAVTT